MHLMHTMHLIMHLIPTMPPGRKASPCAALRSARAPPEGRSDKPLLGISTRRGVVKLTPQIDAASLLINN